VYSTGLPTQATHRGPAHVQKSSYTQDRYKPVKKSTNEFKTVVFIGPTLRVKEAKKLLEAEYRSPVKMGDIYTLLGTDVEKILIIDGVFHGVRSIWHREILTAIAEGIMVAGAASMGALRAMELAQFGMVGMGRVFEAYNNGTIDGDDEVVLEHADQEHGFKSMSVPLINIRFTLSKAVSQGVITPEQANRLAAFSQQQFYPMRNYESIIRESEVAQWDIQKKQGLKEFFLYEAHDQKAEDAKQLLRFVSEGNLKKKSQVLVEKIPHLDPLYASTAINERVVVTSEGKSLKAGDVIKFICSNPTESKEIFVKLNSLAFTLYWAENKNISCPDKIVRIFSDKITAGTFQKHSLNPYPLVPPLTNTEYKKSLVSRALIDWIFTCNAEDFGIDFSFHQKFLTGWESWNQLQCSKNPAIKRSTKEVINLFRRRLFETALHCEWAIAKGISVTESAVEKSLQAFEASQAIEDRSNFLDICGLTNQSYMDLHKQRALSRFILEKGPAYFGIVSYCYELEIIVELCFSGRFQSVLEDCATKLSNGKI